MAGLLCLSEFDAFLCYITEGLRLFLVITEIKILFLNKLSAIMFPPMSCSGHIKELGIIAGRGVYPGLLAKSARQKGVERIFVIAFKGETDRSIERIADEVRWLRIGKLQKFYDALESSKVGHVVMAGQIKPTHLFKVRMDKAMLSLLAGLKERNAHTIFGEIVKGIRDRGIQVEQAHVFMDSAMPAEGLIAGREPTDRERSDIELGLRVAKITSGLDIGQTVVVKEGAILAVEAFEGTDEAIDRAGRLGGRDAVVIKAAKQGHDMRFDIPVVGEHTFKRLKKIGASALAVEAERTILLEREKLIKIADRQGLSFVAIRIDRESRSS